MLKAAISGNQSCDQYVNSWILAIHRIVSMIMPWCIDILVMFRLDGLIDEGTRYYMTWWLCVLDLPIIGEGE